jgi:hypothetical protein
MNNFDNRYSRTKQFDDGSKDDLNTRLWLNDSTMSLVYHGLRTSPLWSGCLKIWWFWQKKVWRKSYAHRHLHKRTNHMQIHP